MPRGSRATLTYGVQTVSLGALAVVFVVNAIDVFVDLRSEAWTVLKVASAVVAMAAAIVWFILWMRQTHVDGVVDDPGH